MLIALLIIVSVGFLITLSMLLFGGPKPATALPSSPSSNFKGELESESKARARLESELERKRKELDEQRSQLQEVKEQLKQAKRKNYNQREAEKGEKDLAKARSDVERNASMQLDIVRGELAQAEAEIARLRSESDMGGRGNRRPAAPPPCRPLLPLPSSPRPPRPSSCPLPRSRVRTW